ncbi:MULTISPECIES: hypothetical protein [unclassified Sphingopyxis]|uniref:hypothetical protein n=1 Tax=unclassified Sphingopyxis TaxID=2614943 RepID=UPI001F23C82E|nr:MULTISPECIES: hypothetical protein [unclassified Sphingopyxis]
MSTPANFDGARPVIDPDDAVMLLIDHQSGLFQTVGDMPMTELRARAGAHALARWPRSQRLPIFRSSRPRRCRRGRTAR